MGLLLSLKFFKAVCYLLFIILQVRASYDPPFTQNNPIKEEGVKGTTVANTGSLPYHPANNQDDLRLNINPAKETGSVSSQALNKNMIYLIYYPDRLNSAFKMKPLTNNVMSKVHRQLEVKKPKQNEDIYTLLLRTIKWEFSMGNSKEHVNDYAEHHPVILPRHTAVKRSIRDDNKADGYDSKTVDGSKANSSSEKVKQSGGWWSKLKSKVKSVVNKILPSPSNNNEESEDRHKERDNNNEESKDINKEGDKSKEGESKGIGLMAKLKHKVKSIFHRNSTSGLVAKLKHKVKSIFLRNSTSNDTGPKKETCIGKIKSLVKNMIKVNSTRIAGKIKSSFTKAKNKIKNVFSKKKPVEGSEAKKGDSWFSFKNIKQKVKSLFNRNSTNASKSTESGPWFSLTKLKNKINNLLHRNSSNAGSENNTTGPCKVSLKKLKEIVGKMLHINSTNAGGGGSKESCFGRIKSLVKNMIKVNSTKIAGKIKSSFTKAKNKIKNVFSKKKSVEGSEAKEGGSWFSFKNIKQKVKSLFHRNSTSASKSTKSGPWFSLTKMKNKINNLLHRNSSNAGSENNTTGPCKVSLKKLKEIVGKMLHINSTNVGGGGSPIKKIKDSIKNLTNKLKDMFHGNKTEEGSEKKPGMIVKIKNKLKKLKEKLHNAFKKKGNNEPTDLADTSKEGD